MNKTHKFYIELYYKYDVSREEALTDIRAMVDINKASVMSVCERLNIYEIIESK